MHPILAQGRRLGLYLFLFLQAGWLLGEVLASSTGAPRPQAALVAVPLLLIHAWSCLASWYLCRSLPLGPTRPERLIVAQLAAALAASGLLVAIGTLWASALDRSTAWQDSAWQDSAELFAEGRTLVFVFAFLVFSLAVAVHYLFLAAAASRRAEGRAYELRILAQGAELKALKAQLDPHFLFNSLNSISGFVVADPEKARRMCVRLADFLRRSLKTGDRSSISLAEEMALVGSYLDIERVRFGDRLTVERAVDEAAAGCRVPPLILQPLVENAVRHGIAQCLDGGTVSLAARVERGRLAVAVENPYDGDIGTRRSGLGLANVRRRLAVAYGGEGSLRIEEKGGRFRVELSLPAQEAPTDD